jgi:hypothetical protein
VHSNKETLPAPNPKIGNYFFEFFPSSLSDCDLRLKLTRRRLVDSTVVGTWALGVALGLWLLHWLLVKGGHWLVARFGLETTAVVLTAQHYEEDGDAYLQGDYVYKDASGQEHTFAFTICSYWPDDDYWRQVMQSYTQGAQNRVRYVRWLPTLHEIQTSTYG